MFGVMDIQLRVTQPGPPVFRGHQQPTTAVFCTTTTNSSVSTTTISSVSYQHRTSTISSTITTTTTTTATTTTATTTGTTTSTTSHPSYEIRRYTCGQSPE